MVYAEVADDDTELFPVAYYIDNWSFTEAENDKPTKSWQQLPIFEEDTAVFDTSRNSKHPCFDGTSLKSYANEKYIVLDFTLKGTKKLIAPLRIFENNTITYNGNAITVTGYGAISITQNEWHRITYVLDMENTTIAGSKVSGIKPHELYIDGEIQTKTKPNDTTSVENVRTWLEIKNGQNNSVDNADVAYMGHYRTYVMDRITVKDSSVKSGDVIPQNTEEIKLEFSHTVDAESAKTNVILKKDNDEVVSAAVSAEGKNVTVVPENELEYGRNYIVVMTGLLSEDGSLKYDAEDISFFTKNQPLYKFGDISADGKINITSSWPENRTAVFTVCTYNSDGMLADVKSIKEELAYDTAKEITLTENIPQSGKIKVFVFDGDLSLAYAAFTADISNGAIEGTEVY